MKISGIIAGAGLALTLAAFSPAAFAQNSNNWNGNRSSNWHGNSTSNWNGNEGRGNSKFNNPQAEANRIQNEINDAESNGANVVKAQREERLGEQDLNYAREHFEQAENELNEANEANNNQNNNGSYARNYGSNANSNPGMNENGNNGSNMNGNNSANSNGSNNSNSDDNY